MRKMFVLLIMVTSQMVLFGCTPPSDISIIDREEKFEKNARSIEMWSMDFEEWENQITIKQRMDFNENISDGLQLSQTFVASDNFWDMIRSARETNNVPDIYMVSYGNLYEEIKNNNIIELSSYLSFSSFDDLTDLAKSAITYDGKAYAYPINMEPSTLIYYRKDLLMEYAGVTTVPSNWSDFLLLLEKVNQGIKSSGTKGVYSFDVPKGIALGWASWGLQISATGGLAITDDWTTSRMNEPGYKQLAELWYSLYSNKYVPLSSGNYNEIINDLCLGKLVMTTAGSYSVPTIVNNYPELIDQIGIVEMPSFSSDNTLPNATNGGWVYVISKQCQDIEAAVKVLEYLVAGEDITRNIEYFESVFYSKGSPRKSVNLMIEQKSNEQDDIPKEWIEIINTVAAKSVMEPIYPWDISIAVQAVLENVILGYDIDSEIMKCDKKIKNIIINNNLANNNPRN